MIYVYYCNSFLIGPLVSGHIIQKDQRISIIYMSEVSKREKRKQKQEELNCKAEGQLKAEERKHKESE